MDDYDAMMDRDVYGKDGERIGTIDSLYVSGESREPVFATVKTGWFSGSSFIPLAEAEMDKDQIVVPYTKDQVKDAPNIEHDRELAPDEENRLYEYYRMERSGSEMEDEDYEEDDDEYDEEEDAGDTMTRSEEELNVGKRTEETGRYRLRKYVVTDNVTRTVPVEHEEVRVEREPITGEGREGMMDDSDLSEDEREVVTHAEVPTVDKKVVPKERIHLNKQTVQDDRTLNEEVRRERVDLDADDDDL